MVQSLPYLKESASQTAGPYVHIGLAPGAAGFDIYRQELGQTIAGADVPGERIRIEGLVYDGTGAPVKDILLESWQADANGIYPHPEDPRHGEVAPGFRGWGRIITDFDSGLWSFETIKPGPVPGRNRRMMAPHISLWLVSRGINIGLNTRMYFDDEDNSADPVLGLVEQENRRRTLIAKRTAPGVYRFDIRLQGEGETVFLDV
ncbi:protocatechuate 3,4-dioxygenase subunit alpha [Bosea sp. (in: a-proteobacteria)]|jgi:protocatechuate 3,4-dioxygenase alpha subunit|uniref:protocatechuate 3,4-dioxygenase subunit alpha n=1 Tax=Bosea sp. (in: a-proteobacteria) TaxID=1871050 RepID=UPI002DDD254C|nr:protocatechuate 3,4-dioxygenase subunit alpha [Bosea sp. (in: a-proteobacteria)]HEV2511525.1 protocatechuate 3,4-dioxygenase subunit alpha [Bosea sp. (in: a-proteobacteria)]